MNPQLLMQLLAYLMQQQQMPMQSPAGSEMPFSDLPRNYYGASPAMQRGYSDERGTLMATGVRPAAMMPGVPQRK